MAEKKKKDTRTKLREKFDQIKDKKKDIGNALRDKIDGYKYRKWQREEEDEESSVYKRLNMIDREFENHRKNIDQPDQQKKWQDYLSKQDDKAQQAWKEQGFQHTERATNGMKWEIWGDGKKYLQIHDLRDNKDTKLLTVEPKSLKAENDKNPNQYTIKYSGEFVRQASPSIKTPQKNFYNLKDARKDAIENVNSHYKTRDTEQTRPANDHSQEKTAQPSQKTSEMITKMKERERGIDDRER